jgi:hypothetical protein
MCKMEPVRGIRRFRIEVTHNQDVFAFKAVDSRKSISLFSEVNDVCSNRSWMSATVKKKSGLSSGSAATSRAR